eukprot:GGOE01021017.1.p1 GENE.GGOE01021017.1~~GGOE01021017.1.p1  ORF type:complete len:356 (+),score=57.95 GGOE01021017.1:69-1070(+)
MTSSTSFFGTPPLTAARPVTPAAELKGLLLPPDDGSLPPPMPPTGGSPSPLPAMSGPSPSAPPPLSSSPLIVGRSIGELSARCEALEKELAQVVHRLQARDQRDRTANSVGIVVSTVQAPVPEKENDEVIHPPPEAPLNWKRPEGAELAAERRPLPKSRTSTAMLAGGSRRAPSPQPHGNQGRIFTSISEQATALPRHLIGYRPISAPSPFSGHHSPSDRYSNGPQPKSMSRPVTQGTAAAHRHPARSASPTATTLRSRRAGPRRVLQVGDWQVETAETNWDPPAHGYVLAAACTQVRGRPGHHQSRLNEALQFVHAMLDAVEIGSPPKARPR